MESSQLFFIERQESLAQDKFNKNGRTMDLHIVAKNIAFVVHIGAAFDLNQSPPTAKLVYDFTNVDEDEKEVEAMKSVPMEFIAHVDETGFKAAVEVKIAVLSSQHEGAYFRVKFSAVDPLSRTLLEEYSQPIKVMSKQNQVKKMMERKTNKRAAGDAPVSPDGDGLFTPPSAPAAPKRSLSGASNDAMLDAISRLEEQQREQTKMLQALLSQGSRDPQPIRQPVSIPDPDDMDFETAFLAFLKAYKKVPQEERASKIRKVVQTAGETDNLSEIVGLYSLTQSSGIGGGEYLSNFDEDVAGKCSESNCRCEECPHKRQLSRLDDFFHDFLSDPLSPEAL